LSIFPAIPGGKSGSDSCSASASLALDGRALLAPPANRAKLRMRKTAETDVRRKRRVIRVRRMMKLRLKLTYSSKKGPAVRPLLFSKQLRARAPLCGGHH